MAKFVSPLVALDFSGVEAAPAARPVEVGAYWVVRVHGFADRQTLRCRVERVAGDDVLVRTADLSDAGSPLLVDSDDLLRPE